MRTYDYIGVDVSKAVLDIAYLSEGSWQKGQISNTVDAIRAWLCSLASADTCLVLEPTGTYHDKLLSVASEESVALVLVNPLRSHYYMQAEGHLHRNDSQAARSLAQLAQEKQLLPTQVPDPMKKQRKQLHMALKALSKQRRMLKNQLHALAQLYQAHPRVQKSLETTLETVETQIGVIEEELHGLDEAEPEALGKLIQSVVGIGPGSLRQIRLHLGDLSQFQSAKQLLKFAGVAPARHQSGSSVYSKARITKQGPSQLRATLYMAARAARKHNLACKELYLRLRKRGKPHKLAMIAVVAKMLTQVFAVVKSGVEFDNQFYLKYR